MRNYDPNALGNSGIEPYVLLQAERDELRADLAAMTERAEKAEAALAEIARPYKEALELIDRIKTNYKV